MKKLAIVLLMAAAGLSGTAMAADKPSVLVVLASGFEEGETVGNPRCSSLWWFSDRQRQYRR